MFSTRGFFDALKDAKTQPRANPNLLNVYLAVYDTLVDDDEDVRDRGAATVSTILSRTEHNSLEGSRTIPSLSPPAAKCKLLTHITNEYSMSAALQTRAMERLSGAQARVGSKHSSHGYGKGTVELYPVSEISAAARKPQNAVFVEEKQNLYIDDVKEAEIWAEVLIGLPANACDTGANWTLLEWFTEGMVHFHELFEHHTDGPLGLTSKTEMFVLITRVLLVAKVLISRAKSLQNDGDSSTKVCRDCLSDFYDQGRKVDLHALLLGRVKSILELAP